MFGIVIIFVVCNVPRIILNMEELFAIAPSYWKTYNTVSSRNMTQSNLEPNEPFCYSPPFWAHILRIFSKVLLILNASVGCFVYCVMCSAFRAEMSNQFRKMITFVIKIPTKFRFCWNYKSIISFWWTFLRVTRFSR